MAEQIPIKFEFWGNQTFTDFFPANNQAIVDHLQNTVKGSGEGFIFLSGELGHGKTHLLHACCELAYNIGVSCFYFDLATKAFSTDIFDDLENVELICLDNIQAILGNYQNELAFFNFFNRHRDNQHRLIITADSPAHKLPIDLPDLTTRLNWGLSLTLHALQDDDKITLLSHKAQQLGFEIPPQSARYLLTHYDRRLTTLWSALDKLDLASLAAQRKLTVPFLKEVLSL